MAPNGQYVANEQTFKRYAYTALKSCFPNQAGFESFYAGLRDAVVQDEFLRVTSFYLFLVKQGDWQVTVEGSNPAVDYLSNSFKVVALFALIESMSDERHQEFYEWLRSRDNETTFPIPDLASLSRLNQKYKTSYGSIRRCIGFFSSLAPARQRALCNAIKVNGKPLASIKKVAEFLYELRSKFVHEARLVPELSSITAFSMRDRRVVETELSIDTLVEAFEEGVLVYFSRGR